MDLPFVVNHGLCCPEGGDTTSRFILYKARMPNAHSEIVHRVQVTTGYEVRLRFSHAPSSCTGSAQLVAFWGAFPSSFLGCFPLVFLIIIGALSPRLFGLSFIGSPIRNGKRQLQRHGSDRGLNLSGMACNVHCRMQIQEALEVRGWVSNYPRSRSSTPSFNYYHHHHRNKQCKPQRGYCRSLLWFGRNSIHTWPMTWLVAVHVYWSPSKEISGQSSQKSICTLPSLVVTSDIGLLLGFCVIFVLVYDSQSQKQILVGSPSISSTIETIFFPWVSPICPKRACKISFLPFFKALATISRADNGLIGQFGLFISHTRSILDPVMIVFPPWCKYILGPLVFISTPCSLSWPRDNKFALASGKPNTSLIVADDSKLSSFKHESFIFPIPLKTLMLDFKISRLFRHQWIPFYTLYHGKSVFAYSFACYSHFGRR